MTPEDILWNSAKKVWWQCVKGHEWEASVGKRTSRNSKCPYCSGKRVNRENCLQSTHPDLAKEWHYLKNGSITPLNVTYGSNKKVWWLCKKGHEWEASLGSRSGKHKTGCPYCSNKRVSHDNCLATTNPELAKEWHPQKNKELRPVNVVAVSKKKVWWQCKNLHEWEATIDSRNRGSGCPHCYNLRRRKFPKKSD